MFIVGMEMISMVISRSLQWERKATEEMNQLKSATEIIFVHLMFNKLSRYLIFYVFTI